jgi:HEAT repeat protein
MNRASAWLAAALAACAAGPAEPSAAQTTARPMVISSTHSMPPGTPFSRWDHYDHLDLLRANGFGSDRAAWCRAALGDEAVLRAAALALLAEAPAEADRSCLERALSDRDPSTRAWAALATARLGRVQSQGELRELAAQPLASGDSSPLIAAVALARLGDATGFPAVTAALSRVASRALAVRCLFDFARIADVWPQFAIALGDSDPVVRELALVQLEELRDRRSADILQQFVTASHDEARQTRARALLAALRTP